MKLNYRHSDSYARRNTLMDTRLKARGIPRSLFDSSRARHDDLLCEVCARVLICVKFLDFVDFPAIWWFSLKIPTIVLCKIWPAFKCRDRPSDSLMSPRTRDQKRSENRSHPPTYIPETTDLGKISITRQFMITASERAANCCAK